MLDQIDFSCIPFVIKKAYTIKDAQRGIAALVRTVERGEIATITRHDRPVAYMIGADRLAAIGETMEILANPKAMRAIRAVEAGKTKSIPAEDLPE